MLAIPDEILKCVVFIGYGASDGEMKLVGSAFFMENTCSGRSFQFLVTAGHLIDEISGKGVEVSQVRVNLGSGVAAWCPIPIKSWIRSPHVDVACTCVNLAADHDHSPILQARWDESGSSEDVIQTSIGNELFIPGLFWPHHGLSKNVPIIRTGSVAAMPGEPIQTKRGPTIGYLIECRSIGGVAGSPVFRHMSGFRGLAVIVADPGFSFLGLVQDHFDIETVSNEAEQGSLNLGIGVVIPGEQVISVIKALSDVLAKIPENNAAAK
jgi:hypothetical protein